MVTEDYVYGPLGRRLARMAGASETQEYGYDLGANPAMVRCGSGKWVRSEIYPGARRAAGSLTMAAPSEMPT